MTGRPDPAAPYAAAPPAITLYTRPGCHLCEDAVEVLQRIGAAFAEIDIESSDELHKRYLERIPVLVLDGEELYDFFIDEDDLRSRLSGDAVT